jgi:glycosyltransferase involved in cell wall biosynthesis
MKNMVPRISIITPTFNVEHSFDRTMESILGQTYKNWEHIVIDGGSKDNSVEVIKKYEKHFKYWHSKPDKGIYDGMNLGVAQATGDYIIFMNSGDVFYSPTILEEIAPILDEGKYDMVYGNVVYIYENGLKRLAKPLSMDKAWMDMPFSHQSLFAKRTLMMEYPFDLNYRISADYHFIYSVFKKGASFYNTNKTIAIFEGVGASVKRQLLTIKERERTVQSFGFSPGVFLYYKLLYVTFFLKNNIRQFIPKGIWKNIVAFKNKIVGTSVKDE